MTTYKTISYDQKETRRPADYGARLERTSDV
jgi:hypothetical protein